MPIALAEVVAIVESDGNSSAIRFEPGVYATFKLTDDQTANSIGALIRQIEGIHNCSPDTARVILSSSWGRFQVMGETLYGNGYGSGIVAYLSSDADQIASFETFCRFAGMADADLADCSWLLGTDPRALQFATRYNGPGQPTEYLARLRQAYSEVEGL